MDNYERVVVIALATTLALLVFMAIYAGLIAVVGSGA